MSGNKWNCFKEGPLYNFGLSECNKVITYNFGLSECSRVKTDETVQACQKSCYFENTLERKNHL